LARFSSRCNSGFNTASAVTFRGCISGVSISLSRSSLAI
jgi:hypothetical protein